jgi:hypothetical protein
MFVSCMYSVTRKAQLSTCYDVVFCWSADFQHLAFYAHREEYETKLLPVTLYITVAWGWSMFVTNSLMTGAIMYKIA